jgi:hypothetical protein
MLATLLQLRATGGEPAVGVAALGLSVLSITLSLAIAGVLVRGYRRGPGRAGMLWLAVGLLLLTTIPELLRVLIPTVTAVGTVVRSLLISSAELSGLGVILLTVYGRVTE